MAKFLVKRIASLFIVILGMTLLVFVATNLLPADPARSAAGPSASKEQVEQKRQELGLDKPLPEQYLKSVKNLLTLDMGTSIRNKQPITEEISTRLSATMELTIVSLIIYFLLSILLGSIAALKRGKAADQGIRLFSVGSMAIPPYWMALLLQLLFYYVLRWLPAGGRLPVTMAAPDHATGFYILDSILSGNMETLKTSIIYMIMPVTSLVLGNCGLTTRMMRSQLLEELHQDYVRTARAKGASEKAVVLKHALKNSISPILTMVGMQAGGMIGGTVLIEKIFRWPGLGSYAVDVIAQLDFPAVTGIAITMSVFFVLINLIVDILYVVIDPRVRLT